MGIVKKYIKLLMYPFLAALGYITPLIYFYGGVDSGSNHSLRKFLECRPFEYSGYQCIFFPDILRWFVWFLPLIIAIYPIRVIVIRLHFLFEKVTNNSRLPSFIRALSIFEVTLIVIAAYIVTNVSFMVIIFLSGMLGVYQSGS